MNNYTRPAKEIVTNQAGFTIIELLIAVAIFSIGFMAVGGLQIMSLNRVGLSVDKTIAMAMLEDQVETLKQTPFYMDDFDNNNGVDEDGDGDDVFDLSPAFVEQGTEPDINKVNGEYETHIWVGNAFTIPNRWIVGGPAIKVSKPVRVAVTRAGRNPDRDALMSVQFVKSWITD
jgi:prepilin-type N-terminal cleavage/methylation domain-containing protein